jgi:hypothetical protein
MHTDHASEHQRAREPVMLDIFAESTVVHFFTKTEKGDKYEICKVNLENAKQTVLGIMDVNMTLFGSSLVACPDELLQQWVKHGVRPYKPYTYKPPLKHCVGYVRGLTVMGTASTLTEKIGKLGLTKLTLKFVYSPVDLTPLQNIRFVHIENCRGISDVSALGGVESLTLRDCPSVTDVAVLAGVTYLTLSECHSVSDVSALADVRCLTIHNCDKVEDVSLLRNQRLSIMKCPITDVSCVAAEYLRLHDCQRLEALVGLRKVRFLYVSFCRALVDISGLGVHYDLHVKIRACPKLTKVTCLRKAGVVELEDMPGVKDVSALLGSVKSLMITKCYGLC